MSEQISPPRLAVRLLEWRLPPEIAEASGHVREVGVGRYAGEDEHPQEEGDKQSTAQTLKVHDPYDITERLASVTRDLGGGRERPLPHHATSGLGEEEEKD